MTVINGWKHVAAGKVRELFVPDVPADGGEAAQDVILVVATDRISAFDFILDSEIPGKGEVLTSVTEFWLSKISKELGIETHNLHSCCITDQKRQAQELPVIPPVPAQFEGRAMVCERLEMLPVECVVRGYLTGSAYKEYLETGKYQEFELPAGLEDGANLTEILGAPIFTPAYKAELGDHDENITFAKMIEVIGEEYAQQLRDLSIKIFKYASEVSDAAGMTLVDTKFEFGIRLEEGPNGWTPTGEVVLGDEVLTPDSSRYWNADKESFDKQYVRNWLLEDSGWSPSSGEKPPKLPQNVIDKTSQLYKEVLSKLTNIK
jgi:phosphoribosylaminoimidazole-succinocarboxamide synthase